MHQSKRSPQLNEAVIASVLQTFNIINPHVVFVAIESIALARMCTV